MAHDVPSKLEDFNEIFLPLSLGRSLTNSCQVLAEVGFNQSPAVKLTLLIRALAETGSDHTAYSQVCIHRALVGCLPRVCCHS